MSQMIAIRRVKLASHHLTPGRTKHHLADANGTRDFPPFVSLSIVHEPGGTACYLMHECENGPGTDTWHQSLDAAIHQAEWEFGVLPEEWKVIEEPY
jgi:hypothetical protein